MSGQPILSDAQKAQFETDGFCVLENVISPEHLQMLRDECQQYIDKIDAEMDAEGVTVKGLNHKGSRYFLAEKSKNNPRLRQFLFSPLMAQICRETIGDDAYLFLDQYVVKAAEKGMAFSWHQDGGYIGYDHKPYLSCWCTLDDVSEANGTVYMLPYSAAGGRDYKEHILDPATNDKVGYFGTEPGIPVIAPAGSIAIFTSQTFHRSGYNQTTGARRVLLAQYSAEPLLTRDGSKPRILADPFVKNGEIVGA